MYQLHQSKKTTHVGGTALNNAACEEHPEIVKFIINHIARNNLQDEFDNTALHLAAHYNRPDLVAKYLPKKPIKKDFSAQESLV